MSKNTRTVLVEEDGFRAGYMSAGSGLNKRAFESGLDITAPISSLANIGWSAGTSISKKMLALAVVAPIVFGVTAGTLSSALTSPSAADADNLQKRLIDEELDVALTDMKRRKEFARKKENRPQLAERDLRIV